MCRPGEVCCRLCLASSISPPYIFLLEVRLKHFSPLKSKITPGVLSLLWNIKILHLSSGSSLLAHSVMGKDAIWSDSLVYFKNICKQSPVLLYRCKVLKIQFLQSLFVSSFLIRSRRLTCTHRFGAFGFKDGKIGKELKQSIWLVEKL